MSRSILRLVSIAMLWLPSSTVFGQDMPLRGPMPFASFDTNGDNMISPQEYVEAHNLRKKLRAEASMPMPRRATPSFTDFDSNADNLISREELQAGRDAMGRGGRQGQSNMGADQGRGMGMGRNMPSFSDFDLNGDGVLLKEEFYDARARRMYQRAEQGFPLRNAANAPDFETVDTNGDGKISEDEFKAHQAEHRKMQRNQ